MEKLTQILSKAILKPACELTLIANQYAEINNEGLTEQITETGQLDAHWIRQVADQMGYSNLNKGEYLTEGQISLNSDQPTHCLFAAGTASQELAIYLYLPPINQKLLSKRKYLLSSPPSTPQGLSSAPPMHQDYQATGITDSLSKVFAETKATDQSENHSHQSNPNSTPNDINLFGTPPAPPLAPEFKNPQNTAQSINPEPHNTTKIPTPAFDQPTTPAFNPLSPASTNEFDLGSTHTPPPPAPPAPPAPPVAPPAPDPETAPPKLDVQNISTPTVSRPEQTAENSEIFQDLDNKEDSTQITSKEIINSNLISTATDETSDKPNISISLPKIDLSEQNLNQASTNKQEQIPSPEEPSITLNQQPIPTPPPTATAPIFDPTEAPSSEKKHDIYPTKDQHTPPSLSPEATITPVVPPVVKQETSFDYGPLTETKTLSHEGIRINALLKSMVQLSSSDLHLSIGQPVIYRIDGEIQRQSGEPLTPEQMAHFIDPIIPDSKRTPFQKTWDTDFAYAVPSLGRFRVNLFRNQSGVAAVLRHIPDQILSAENLGLSEAIIKFSKLSKGLVLVTGPTGSGKSTTLAAIIDLINMHRTDHILTIEDPIEFVHPQKKCLINQREVGKHTEKFATALRAALREDPDVVLVGELRDLETTSIAIETAETGHLVFATLHTNTAISSVSRIVDQYPGEQQSIVRNMLSSSLRGVVSQVLCKKTSGGRAAAHEILVVSDPVKAMIREGKTHMVYSHMQTQAAEGNITLSSSLANLVKSGTVQYDEAWSKAVDKKDFEGIAKRMGISPI